MTNVRQFELERETELCIEVGPNYVTVRTSSGPGSDEIFSAEMPPNTWIPIPAHQNIVILTWKGATIEVNGESEVDYVADEYHEVITIVNGKCLGNVVLAFNMVALTFSCVL